MKGGPTGKTIETVYVKVPNCGNVVRGYVMQKSETHYHILLPCGLCKIRQEEQLLNVKDQTYTCRFCQEATR
jgi:hypothetical protein